MIIRGKAWALILGLILIIVGIGLLVLYYSVNNNSNNLTCSQDSDCAPSSCCHATSCINKANVKPCNLLCTQSCETILDCGQGSCKCINNKCEAIAN
jgi:hypothetical protein